MCKKNTRRGKELKKRFATLIAILLTSMLVPPVCSQVVPAYDWVQVGAFAKYTNRLWPPNGLIFPNGTRIEFHGELKTPAVLEWTIISEADTSVRLNLTFFISCGGVVFRKTLLVDVDVYTRDSFIDGEPIGKTCFWGKPYAELHDKIVLYGLPSEQMVANVTRARTVDFMGEEMKVYHARVFQLDPFAIFTSRFIWHTGMAQVIVLPGQYPVDPKGSYSYGFANGTEVEIKRFAHTPLDERLCVYAGGSGYVLSLDATNVRLGPKPEGEDTSDIGFGKYYPYVFVAALVVLTGALMGFYMRRRGKKTKAIISQ